MKKISIKPLLILAVLFLTLSVQAQVRIGDGNAPTAGTTLDLNADYKGGLKLPQVDLSINGLGMIPAAFTGIGASQETNASLKGTMVYNTATATEGVYCWDGSDWTLISGKTVFDPATIPDAVAGTYFLTGTTCFDVAMTDGGTTCGPLASRTNSFASGYSFTYTLSGAAYTDLNFELVAASPITTGISDSGVLTFKSDVRTLVQGNQTGVEVTVYAVFKNNLGVLNKIALKVMVKDCQCCGINGTATSQRIGNNNYLTHLYPTGTAGAMECWMVENSKEGTSSATTYPSHTAGERGYYYTWAQSTTTTQANSPCPSGWHLPGSPQWELLKANVTNTTTGSGAYWNAGSAFAGYYLGSIWIYWGSTGFWWSASASSQYYNNSGTLNGPYTNAGNGWFSVRCVQN